MTIKRARNVEGNYAFDLKSRPHKRVILLPESIDHAHRFIDDEIPIRSGRDHRIQLLPDQALYDKYYRDAANKGIKPLSKTYFVYSLLACLKIHHSKDATICDLCKSFSEVKGLVVRTEEEEKKFTEGSHHQLLWLSQSQYYLDIKSQLQSGKLGKDSLIIVQDFTQVQAQSTFYQSLIICIYGYDEKEKDLERNYHHFMGESASTKNDVWFVVSVWKKMVEDNFFDGIKNIYIFSDGGPKHFKITSCLSFFSSLQEKYPFSISYNFFESYHGHSICDGVAAHAKEFLNRYQRINQIPLKKSKDIVELISHVHNHAGHLAPPSELITDNFPTFNGIRSYYKFTFRDKSIFAFQFSKDLVHSKVYQRNTYNFFPK